MDMHEIHGDLWELPADLRVVTTNGQIRSDGRAVMGKGIALQAARRYPELAQQLADCLKSQGNHVFVFGNIATFPTKDHWRDPSIPDLIEQSARELRKLVDTHEYQRVLLPPVGCGEGGLQWDMVRLLIGPYFDKRFSVVHYRPTPPPATLF